MSGFITSYSLAIRFGLPPVEGLGQFGAAETSGKFSDLVAHMLRVRVTAKGVRAAGLEGRTR